MPFFSTLSAWIYEGELRDPFDEFFIAVNPSLAGGADERDRNGVDEDGGGMLGDGGWGRDTVRGAELWESKFEFRREMLPGFLEEAFGRKVRTGHSLNLVGS